MTATLKVLLVRRRSGLDKTWLHSPLNFPFPSYRNEKLKWLRLADGRQSAAPFRNIARDVDLSRIEIGQWEIANRERPREHRDTLVVESHSLGAHDIHCHGVTASYDDAARFRVRVDGTHSFAGNNPVD